MYARVLRKWSLHTKPQMSIIMWRLLLLTLLLLCLCASSVKCNTTTIINTSITNTNTNSLRVSRRSTAPPFAPAIASAFMSPVTANASATAMSARKTNAVAAAAAGAAESLQHSLTPLPLSISAATAPPPAAAAAAPVGDIIEESFYIPVDGDDTDSNIYDSRLVQALDVGSVLGGGSRESEGVRGAAAVGVNNRDGWRIRNSYNSGSSSSSSSSDRLFSSSSNVVSSSSSKNRRLHQQVQQREQEQLASATYAGNMAYAYYRRATPPTLHISPKLTQTSTETKTTTTTTINAAPQTVFSPQFSVQHIANDENVAVDDDDEHEEEERAEDEEEEEELVGMDDAEVDGEANAEAEAYGDADVDEHTSHEDYADDGHTQQKVPNNKNSHIINLFNTYTHNNNNYNNPYYKSNINNNPQQQHAYAAGNANQQNQQQRSTKARRHVSAEQRQHRLSLQQQQPHRMALHHVAAVSPTPPSSSSTPMPISQYPTKKVFQLVNGKNLTRIVHLLPPTHYRIAAYEIPSSLPYRGMLTEQQQHMLQHQREQQQQQLQLQQDQAARSRRDSRLFGIAQATGYYSIQQTPLHVSALGQQASAQQQFQRLQQNNGGSSSSSWQQISGSIFQRQPVYHQQQQQLHQRQQQQSHNHQHSGSDGSFGSHHRAAHNHNHKHNGSNNNYNKHNQRQRQHKRPRRYCSARDPAQLAFEAPIVFEGKITSMSPDRRHNFAATVQVLNAYKQQIGYQVKREQFVRLQFAYINSSGECDIYREQLRPRGLVRGDELELQRTYLFFVQQIDMRNFTILGQPIRKTRRVVEAVKDAVSENYAQLASIRTITTNRTMEIGKELHIVCKVQGRPPPKVTWFKDGKSINRNRKLYKFRHFKKRSELIIRSFNISDTGRYECRAKNKINQEPDRRTILIKADPEPRYPTSLTGGTGNVCPDDAAEFCLNGGTCNFFSEIGSYSCICPEGFMGERCDRKEVNNISPSTYSNEQECGEKKFYGSYYC